MKQDYNKNQKIIMIYKKYFLSRKKLIKRFKNEIKNVASKCENRNNTMKNINVSNCFIIIYQLLYFYIKSYICCRKFIFEQSFYQHLKQYLLINN